jgi:DNA mismatch repair protein MutL
LEYQPVEARALAAHLDVLQTVGFRIEEFGENDFLVKGVPTWLGSSDVNELVNELIDVIVDTGLRTDPARFREEMFKTMACKAAVKETQPMRPEEIRNLLTQLDRGGSPEVCPHGRPLTVRFLFSEIRRRIGRK